MKRKMPRREPDEAIDLPTDTVTVHPDGRVSAKEPAITPGPEYEMRHGLWKLKR